MVDKFDFEQHCRYGDGEVKNEKGNTDRIICDMSEGKGDRKLLLSEKHDKMFIEAEGVEATLGNGDMFHTDKGIQIRPETGGVINLHNEETVRGGK